MRSAKSSIVRKMNRVCQLKPIQPEHQTIHLESGVNIVGRKKEIGIRDAKCSRRQLQLQVDTVSCQVQCKIVGLNPSGINGIMVMQDTECILKHGDVLEVVYGRHPYEIVFKPAPDVVDEMKPNTNECPETAVYSDSWDSIENGKVICFTSSGVKGSSKIAAYDMDGTIIKTKSGNVFPKTCDDWTLNYTEVPKKLKALIENGFKIVFFTNQGGIAKGKVNVNEFKQKIKNILAKLQVPVQVFVAIDDGYYRKPLPGMWEYMEEHKNQNLKINKSQSFFVGDAAGRPELGKGKTKRRKDHSLADRLFAHNIGVEFYTPEEHFLGIKKEEWVRPSYNPSMDFEEIPLLDPIATAIPSKECEVIVMMGLPGSGKSFFSQQHLCSRGYITVNADTLGSVQACLKTCENALSMGKSCVVDNTNVDIDSRKKFIDLAKKFKVKCRCFVMNVSLGQVKHNIAFRQLTNPKHSKINEMVLNMMKKRFTPPNPEEGFDEIVKVNVKPSFDRDDWKRLYSLHLVEK